MGSPGYQLGRGFATGESSALRESKGAPAIRKRRAAKRVLFGFDLVVPGGFVYP